MPFVSEQTQFDLVYRVSELIRSLANVYSHTASNGTKMLKTMSFLEHDFHIWELLAELPWCIEHGRPLLLWDRLPARPSLSWETCFSFENLFLSRDIAHLLKGSFNIAHPLGSVERDDRTTIQAERASLGRNTKWGKRSCRTHLDLKLCPSDYRRTSSATYPHWVSFEEGMAASHWLSEYIAAGPE